MAASFSELEVAPSSGIEHYNRYYEGLEHNPAAQYYNKRYEGLEHDPAQHYPTQAHLDSHKQVHNPSAERRRILGLDARVFWVLIAVAAIIGAAVGGGIGGSLAAKNSKVAKGSPTTSSNITSSSLQSSKTFTISNRQTTLSKTSSRTTTSSSTSSDSVQPSDTYSTTPSRTTPSAVELTTTTIIGPSYTLLRDCPSSNNTLYGITLGSASMNFRKICGKSYLNTLDEAAVVNLKTPNLDSCINLCAAYNVQNASTIATGQDNVCNAVCWRNSLEEDDNFPGQCFGYTTQNTSSSFIVEDEPKCDGAAWIDQKIL